ncbi:MAG: class I SAM-dependent methyltransferase [Candidatus Omnitrophica bacterium]|nr:class I SAM-dependent methyltransferase [Candidatus Omnitrophota bacterium]
MLAYRDRALEQELLLGGLHPRARIGILDDVTTYLKKPIEHIAKAYWAYHTGEDLVAQQRVGEATREAEVLAYYQATPHYLYELSYWEASWDKQAWFEVVYRACRRWRLQHVLDFGGGVGGLSVYLNSRGVRCDYLDVAGKTFDYAAWRFRRRGLNVRMFDILSTNGKAQGPYDAIVAWDVLEHLFDLEAALASIRSMLRAQGWFLSKSTFATSGSPHEAIHLAQHAKYGDVRVLNELMERIGFRFLGQLKPSRLSRLLRACGARYAVTGIRLAPKLKHGGNFLVHERVG